ncbi:SDR family NAD(P)-dependent oxidoreductase [Nocardia africana]|uniref:3-oxoacyl-[acyl-carrier-protein] reductase FabG n=1 Tax=Nocardia africana TaxID=134964 RepID=A0A378WPM1_9NOCA|nr:SDR family oxidoreductase [Nocardia africana]MCC3315036.1 SDR family oxidoreductase [Nocardia africana]SUA42677.1 3-oxoacyl-[acyl-carrier-protein] reductase FabG [Nocardia africana]
MTGEAAVAGKAAIVVGGGNGIGRAVAVELARQGAGVVVNSRSGAAVDAVVDEIRAAGGRAVGVAGSAADEAIADALVGGCVESFGAVDVLVNCAGIAEPAHSSILDISTVDWRAQLDSHLTTVFNTCRAVAPLMVARGAGSIVNTGSFAYLGDYGGTGYPAGKGAVASLTLAMAAELKEHGIRVNAICPGARTRLSTGPEYEAKIAELRERGLLDEFTAQSSLDAPPPDYAAALYVYLASDLATATGQIFVAAGGFVGRFARPKLESIGYRDHVDTPPWSVAELRPLLGDGA